MKIKVLIVEDDRALKELLYQLLSRAGYFVETCGEGKEAARRIAASTPDLAIIDWDLPGLNGTELTRQIRSHRRTSSIPILMVTAFNKLSNRDNAFEAGVTDYLTKPFDMYELLDRVHKVFRRANPA